MTSLPSIVDSTAPTGASSTAGTVDAGRDTHHGGPPGSGVSRFVHRVGRAPASAVPDKHSKSGKLRGMEGQTPSDEFLLRRRTDPRARDLLLRRANRAIWYVIHQYPKTHVDQDELYSVGLQAVKEAIDTFDASRGTWSNYLVGIIRFRMVDALRTRGHKRKAEWYARAYGTPIEAHYNLASAAAGPHRIAELHSGLEALAEAMAKLPPWQRRELRAAIQGLPYAKSKMARQQALWQARSAMAAAWQDAT